MQFVGPSTVHGQHNDEENKLRKNAFISCGLQAEESSVLLHVIFSKNIKAKIILAPCLKKISFLHTS
jgi:hypothetical protein